MNAALEALAGADFSGSAPDVWTDARHHVDALHGDLADRLVAEFFARTRAPDALPGGRLLQGEAGAGKTHFFGVMRRRVWEGGGWFVALDLVGAEFWGAAALAFAQALNRPLGSGATQGRAILVAIAQRLGQNPIARAAALASPAGGRSAVEALIAMLGAIAPPGAERTPEVVRAVALLASRDAAIADFALSWLQGFPCEDGRARQLGFHGAPPGPQEIVRDLLWMFSLAGPTLLAVDQFDAIAGEARRDRAHPMLAATLEGLARLCEINRRALVVVACREAAAPLLRKIPGELYRELPPLPPLAGRGVVERLIGARLAPAHARFPAPHPTYPFGRAALNSAAGLAPRVALNRCRDHILACLAAGELRECDTLARASTAPRLRIDDALDAAFAAARKAVRPPAMDDAPALAALIGAACALFARQLDLPETIEARAPAQPALHGVLVFTFHGAQERQLRWSWRLLGRGDEGEPKARIGAAVTASGLGAAGRRLIVLADSADALKPFTDAGVEVLAPSRADFALFAALQALAGAHPAAFEPWLRRRKPLDEAELFALAGLAPPVFLGEGPPQAAPSRPASSQRELYLGRAIEPGAALGPVTLPVETLAGHVALFGGPDRGAMLRRLVEEAALTGRPAVVLDADSDFARAGERWPSRPAEFSDDDARKARDYFERVEVVVWTPGASGGRPLTLAPLPDFSVGEGEAREAAIEMAMATLAPALPRSGGKAIKLHGALADALRAFARAGGGALGDLIGLAHDLPPAASRLRDAPELMREIAVQLAAAAAIDPWLDNAEAPFDPARLFEGERGKPRVSVVNLSGLPSAEARRSFVNQLNMALFGYVQRRPGPRFYAVADAAAYLSPKEAAPAKRSLLALAAHAREYGLALAFAAESPAGLDPAVACLTHLYGRPGAAGAKAAGAALAARGGDAADLDGLRASEAYLATEGWARPVKLRSPLSLSRRTSVPPTPEEVLAIAGGAGHRRRLA